MGFVSARSLETRGRQQSVGGFLKTASLRKTLMLAKERGATVHQVSNTRLAFSPAYKIKNYFIQHNGNNFCLSEIEVQPSSICKVHAIIAFNELSLAVNVKPLTP